MYLTYYLLPISGVSLSTISRSSITINPDIKEAHDLRSWYGYKVQMVLLP